MPTVKDLFTYAKYLPEPEAGLDVFGRTSRYINSETNKPFHVIRAVNNVAPAILPNANSELFFEIHARVLKLDKPIAISEEEEDGFRLLTSSFVQGYNGDPNVLLNFSYSTRPIDRSSLKVATRIKGMQSLCKKLGITFTKERAESLVYVIYTYLSVREVKIATSKAISYVIKADEAVKVDDYSDFDKLWDDDTTTAPPVVVTNSSPTNEQLINAANQVQEKIKAATLLLNEWNNATAARTKTAKRKALDPLVTELKAMPDSAFEGLTDQENEQLDTLLELPAFNG